MAGADKIYLSSGDQYKLVKEWWLKTRNKQKKELGKELWMYPFSSLTIYKTDEDGKHVWSEDEKDIIKEAEYDPAESDLDIEATKNLTDFAVFNLSTKGNLWLAKNCPLDFIKEAAIEKLETFWYQEIPDKHKCNSIIDHLDFTVPDKILSIVSKKHDVSLYFYKNSEDKGYIEIIDKLVVYGTTDVLRIIHEAKQTIQGYQKMNGYTIMFTFCGVIFELKNGNLNCPSLKLKDMVIPYIQPDWKDPKIKYSFDIKDVMKGNELKVSPEQIFLSSETSCHSLYEHVDANLKRALFLTLPEYLIEQIKK